MTNAESRYFSQNGEDFLLWNFFEYKKTGFYVDVGAFDGVHLSNTFSFEKQGWDGICIEPHSDYFELCRQSRPRSICLNLACVCEDSKATVEFYSEELGLLSGTAAGREEDVRARYVKRGLPFCGFIKKLVPASTLNAILNKHAPNQAEIDFITIDVEGAELEVLQGLDLSRFRSRVLVIEANTDEDRRRITSHVVDLNGYIEARREGRNIFFTRDLGDAHALKAISLDCQIEPNLHPLGERYTLLPHLIGKRIQPKKSKKHAQTGILLSIKNILRNLFRD